MYFDEYQGLIICFIKYLRKVERNAYIEQKQDIYIITGRGMKKTYINISINFKREILVPLNVTNEPKSIVKPVYIVCPRRCIVHQHVTIIK